MNDIKEDLISNIEEKNQFIDTIFLNNIRFNIELKNQYTETFYNYITKIIQYTMNHNNDILQNTQLLDLLQKFQSISALLENTSTMLTNLENKVITIKNSKDINLQNFNDFTQEYYTTIEKINKNHLEVERFIFYCSTFAKFKFDEDKIENAVSNNENDISNEEIKITTNSAVTEDNIETNKEDIDIIENTLIISETSGKVILPYTLEGLENILKTSDEKFSNIQEIIDKKFTVSYSNYSNPAISRFKEAYKLAKNKEKLSIIQSFNLGTELLFNYNLHPAIISACKNMNELDIYLDYLEEGQTEKFKIFDIKFEVAPIIVN